MKKSTIKLIFVVVALCLPFFVTLAVTGVHKVNRESKETQAVAVVTKPAETEEETYVPSVRKISYVKEEAVHILRKKYGDIYFQNGLDNAFQIIERDEKGNVVEIMVGNVIMSGNRFAEIMKLGSENFKIKVNATNIIFTVINE